MPAQFIIEYGSLFAPCGRAEEPLQKPGELLRRPLLLNVSFYDLLFAVIFPPLFPYRQRIYLREAASAAFLDIPAVYPVSLGPFFRAANRADKHAPLTAAI